MDFVIWGGPGPSSNSGKIYLLMNEDNSWTSVRISYLASARSDFVLGSFSAGTYFLQSSSTTGDITHSYLIPGWTAQSSGFSVIIEISGLKTAATTFQATLTSVTINPSNGLINTNMRLISSPPI